MFTWASDELNTANLGDKRLNRRLVTLVESLAASPSMSIPAACGAWAVTKAAYRFFGAARIMPNTILQPHIDSTCARAATQGIVLAIQDTTYLDFAGRKIEGMGCVREADLQGLLVHSTLCASSDGTPLGLLSQHVWSRDPKEVGKGKTRRQRTTEQKESLRWLDALKETEARVPDSSRVLTIADREADIFDFFAQPRREGSDLLLRVSHNRRVAGDELYLLETIRHSAPKGRVQVEIKRGDDRPSRTAELVMRYGEVAILPPKHHLNRQELQPVRVHLVLAEEVDTPPEQQAISWLLLTTLPVETLEEAAQCLHWYSKRWLVERFHYVLKSGCRIEGLQLESETRIRRALSVYSIVAWRLLWLTYEARRNPDAPCTLVLDPIEWQALYVRTHKQAKLPKNPPTLKEAVGWIAKLGGFLGRKSDGEPGVTTIWRGLVRLNECVEMWSASQSIPRP